jgi:hypothetical protein
VTLGGLGFICLVLGFGQLLRLVLGLKPRFWGNRFFVVSGLVLVTVGALLSLVSALL